MEIEKLYGVGPKLAKTLNILNIYNVNDLLEYYPYRYNFIKFESLNNLENENGFLNCVILTEPKVAYIKRNFNKLGFIARYNNIDFKVIIFNRAFLKNNLKVNSNITLFGKYSSINNTFTASDIKFNLVNNSIEPIYHLTSGLNNNGLRKLIKEGIQINDNYLDYIPPYINEQYKLISKKDAIIKIHNPNNIDDIKKAKLKLIYEEFFKFMFKVNYNKIKEKKCLGIERNIKDIDINNYYNLLPFKLTVDQEKTINEIKNDMLSKERMNRLVLGDVGSGKTIVAAYAIYLNYLSKYQSAMMAPTEILAVQHYKTLTNLFKNTNINIELLTGHMTNKEKKSVYERLANNEIDLIIGTHALLNDKVLFSKLGLVITDEQHRFGVLQRTNLENKGIKPDVLYLSATPIPRTYALTIYGDTDISIIKTKPMGRKEIITKVYKEKEIKIVLEKINEEINIGHQAFIVSPLIENEESDLNSIKDLKDKFNKAFPNRSIEIIHGKLKQEVKDSLMQSFLNKQIDILISTTVIEVGIDIPNATIMTIFNAERFGLATLHQLRGRVGRSDNQSYCFLISDLDNKRLKVMEESNDGFYITEKDFEQRREGDLFGTKQSGDMAFKIGDITRDYKILLQASLDSENFIKNNKYMENDIYMELIKQINFLS